MKFLLIYHFFHPDTVVSARLFSDLAEDLAADGHEVTVFTCNRCIRSQGELSAEESWHGVKIQRFARPDFRQGSNVGRLMNSAILQWKWRRGIAAATRAGQSWDVIIVGTDPQFAYLLLPYIKKAQPQATVLHWAFDVYPEVIAASGGGLMKKAAAAMRPLVARSYRSCDVMADIGDCMRGILAGYGHQARCVTLTPWALAESSAVADVDMAMRRELFGDAQLCFLYSGTVGRAHDITPFITLARRCRERGLSVGFCFAGYGNCYATQTAQLTPSDTNITLAGFASEADLARRLSAADFHLISLRDGWQGIVVPSKFFGALAMGRPVLFDGPVESEITGWIHEHGLGYRLGDTVDFVEVIERLLREPSALETLKAQAFKTYQQKFSRRAVYKTLMAFLS